jgi:hypothetical protein
MTDLNWWMLKYANLLFTTNLYLYISKTNGRVDILLRCIATHVSFFNSYLHFYWKTY